ncbi:ribosomal-processing cysteine protease Prp [Virgibacillus sp. MSJ-26]|uniref:ribosomal-processing cysteine protease Prp n=1 Tax=Virgibacillus sp. MSJ-26 TaxID=2841522 RepID=UPI001C0FACB4|nr:ribosomal-processing cysteine protease Prp [Virgibacillus sp. MSJ-26]MBU5466519.1 ribosomal-processing cysteine protease Prp [Virgibacillus sp. MSJ-26]
MIEVTIYKQKSKISSFEISGHAESGPYGYDLVCAAVSAVSFGSVNAVMELCEVSLDIDQGREGGYLFVEIPQPINVQLWNKVSLLFEAMVVSLQTIEEEYGQFIKIKENKEGL